MKIVYSLLVAFLIGSGFVGTSYGLFGNHPAPSESEQQLYKAINKFWDDKPRYLQVVKDNVGKANLESRFGSDRKTFLIFAIEKNAPEIMEVLLKAGANPDADYQVSGYSTLNYAIIRKKVNCAAVLIEHGASYRGLGRDKIKKLYDLANQKYYSRVVLDILDKKLVDVNSKSFGRTALDYAAQIGDFKMVQALLERKADVTIKQLSNVSIIHTILHAKKTKKFEQNSYNGWPKAEHNKVFNLLIKHGAEVTPKQAVQYARFKFTETGFWRLFITTKITVFMVLIVLATIGAGLFMIHKNELELIGEICLVVLIPVSVIVLIMEGMAVSYPMSNIAVANHPVGWLPYFILRLSVLVTMIPVGLALRDYVPQSDGSASYQFSFQKKSCGACNREVPNTLTAGDVCPHCGVRWGMEQDNSTTAYRSSPKDGLGIFDFLRSK